ncbi:MAG: hypothetical protein KBG28_10465 [Kofleriaceae bacterium]|nr:hypothetical protein [Kofleriaceae bacterium]
MAAPDDESPAAPQPGAPGSGSPGAGAASPGPADRDGDGLSDGIRQRIEALVPEMVKRTFAAGLGALFQTEEGLRKLAKDVQIPDVAGYIASSADATKDRVLEVIARETREFLQHVNVADELARLLTTLSFEIRTEVRFIPNSERLGKVEPDVKTAVRLKRTGRDSTSPDGKDKDGKDKDGKDKDDDDPDERERTSRLRFWRRGESRDRDGDESDDPLE